MKPAIFALILAVPCIFAENAKADIAPVLVPGASGTIETVFVSSQIFTAASAFSIALPSVTSAKIHCTVQALQNTSNGNPNVTFNGDTGAHYNWSMEAISSGGTTNNGAASASLISPLGTTQIPTAGNYWKFDLDFLNATTALTIVTGLTMQVNGANSGWFGHYGGTWANAALPTTMTVTASAGTMTGYAKCIYDK